MKRKKTQKYGLMDVIYFLKCINICQKKKSVYILKLCLEHADNIYVLKKVYEEVRKLRNIFNQ